MQIGLQNKEAEIKKMREDMEHERQQHQVQAVQALRVQEDARQKLKSQQQHHETSKLNQQREHEKHKTELLNTQRQRDQDHADAMEKARAKIKELERKLQTQPTTKREKEVQTDEIEARASAPRLQDTGDSEPRHGRELAKGKEPGKVKMHGKGKEIWVSQDFIHELETEYRAYVKMTTEAHEKHGYLHGQRKGKGEVGTWSTRMNKGKGPVGEPAKQWKIENRA